MKKPKVELWKSGSKDLSSGIQGQRTSELRDLVQLHENNDRKFSYMTSYCTVAVFLHQVSCYLAALPGFPRLVIILDVLLFSFSAGCV